MSTSHAWIAGAVIGPIALVIVIGAIALFMRRRGKRNRSAVVEGDDTKKTDDIFKDKPQLHSDSLVRHELDGERPSNQTPELPVVESAVELAARS